MTHFSYLFSDKPNSLLLEDTKSSLEKDIDKALEAGNCNKEVLTIMKELLQELTVNTSITDYIDEVK